MGIVADIVSPVWGLGITGGGQIVEGLASIRQCIEIIVRTTKGSNPLFPSFGSNVSRYTDYPIQQAIPLIKKEILTAVATWEKRVNVTKITSRIDSQRAFFNINYTLIDQELTDSIEFSLHNGEIKTDINPAQITLQAFFPVNASGFQLSIFGNINEESFNPVPSNFGFSSPYELYMWVKEAWAYYGRWYFAPDNIILVANPTYKTGSMNIDTLKVYKYSGGIAGLLPDYCYSVSISLPDGKLVENFNGLYSPGDILDWVRKDLSSIGQWQLKSTADSFSEDYSDDFETYIYQLEVITESEKPINITISSIPFE